MPGPDSGDRTRNASAPVKTLTVKASVVSCQCIGPVHWSYFASWQRRDLQPSRSHRARFIGAVAKATYHWTMWYVSRPLYPIFFIYRFATVIAWFTAFTSLTNST